MTSIGLNWTGLCIVLYYIVLYCAVSHCIVGLAVSYNIVLYAVLYCTDDTSYRIGKGSPLPPYLISSHLIPPTPIISLSPYPTLSHISYNPTPPHPIVSLSHPIPPHLTPSNMQEPLRTLSMTRRSALPLLRSRKPWQSRGSSRQSRRRWRMTRARWRVCADRSDRVC